MKQKLSLARALLHEPKVLFLDEPTSGLDPEARLEVRNLIRGLKDEKRTVLLCTHNLEETELIRDRIAVMNTSLIAFGKPSELRRKLFTRQMIVELETMDEKILLLISKMPMVKNADVERNRVLVELNHFDADRPELLRQIVHAGGNVLSYTEKSHSLEEIYLSLFDEDKTEGAKK